MAMLADLLKSIGSQLGIGDTRDNGVMTPDTMMQNKAQNSDPQVIYNDAGQAVDYDPGDNPFFGAIAKSRANGNQGPGVLRQMMTSMFGSNPEREKGGLVPDTGTPRMEELLSPIPNKLQKPGVLQPNVPLPEPRPDYTMPQALDPQSIEELRQSLLSDSGQRDPNNPNGLAGRMTSPNAGVDQRNQMNEAQRMTDDLRGFDGARAQRMKMGRNGQ